MKIYLYNIVSRLAQFSQKLDNTTLFVDKPWVLIDKNQDYQKYIFRRNGELIMSLNGKVQVGKWEYLVSAKSILIDRKIDKILLNHFFLDHAVMVFKMDGPNNQLFVLANEREITDLDVISYLQSVIYKKFNVITGRLEDDRTIEVYRGQFHKYPRIGMKVTIDGENPKDGIYKSKSTGSGYQIKNGKIISIY